MFLYLRRHEMSPLASTVCCDLMPAILNTLFTNLSRGFLTNIDWLLQSHGSIGRLDWFINPTITFLKNDPTRNVEKLCGVPYMSNF